MFDPVTNLIASHAARRAAYARRPLEQRARASEKNARTDAADSFENGVHDVEAAGAVRPLGQADGEDAREDRAASTPPAHPRPDQPGPPLDLTA